MATKSRKKFGITESYWASLTEDQKIKWKLLSRILTFVGALAVTKTGVYYIDWAIAACATAFSFLLIESQRSYARYSVSMRKKLVRISIVFGGMCVLFAGLIYFSQVAIFSVASTYVSMPPPNVEGRFHELKRAIYILIFIFAGVFAIIKVFRDLNVMELIYHLPRRTMIRLLVHKEFQLEGLPGFACFELGVILATICYSGLIASLLSSVVTLINIAVSMSE